MPNITYAKCGFRNEISDEQILSWILEDETLCRKAATAMGRWTGGQTKLSAAQRRERALKAVQAREAKRQAETTSPKPSKRPAPKKPEPLRKKKSPPKPKRKPIRKPAPKRRK